MNKNQKIILAGIIILVIIILSIVVILINTKPNNNNNIIINGFLEDTLNESNTMHNEISIQKNDYIENTEHIVEYNKKLDYVKDRGEYFTVKNLYNRYINLVGNREKNSLNNILSQQYKQQYNINENNIINNYNIPELKNSSQYYKSTIIKILKAEIDNNISIYILEGKYRIVNMNNSINDVNLMIEIDNNNNLYYIYPKEYINDKGYNKLVKGDIIDFSAEPIIENKNNKFQHITKTDVEMAFEYFDHSKELLNYYPDIAYTKLNEQYSKNRFENKEIFEEYLKDNSSILSHIKIDKYKVKSNDDYVEYICTDQYDNTYIYREKEGILNYKVFLDNYTIRREEDIKQYNNMNKYSKARYNVAIFEDMLNTKDYNGIYNVLDDTFKANNFNTVEDLKKYIQKNFYSLNEILVQGDDTETYDYAVFENILTNRRNLEETKEMTIIIDLKEGTDFRMSFSFNS